MAYQRRDRTGEKTRGAGTYSKSTVDRFGAFNAKKRRDFFVITDFKEFYAQEELREFLERNFSVMEKNERYLIFDLRRPIP